MRSRKQKRRSRKQRWRSSKERRRGGVLLLEVDCLAQVCAQVCLVTQCVMQVLLPNQFQVLFDGFGCQRVLPEDQHVVVGAAVHL